jgi:hypothetical protein
VIGYDITCLFYNQDLYITARITDLIEKPFTPTTTQHHGFSLSIFFFRTAQLNCIHHDIDDDSILFNLSITTILGRCRAEYQTNNNQSLAITVKSGKLSDEDKIIRISPYQHMIGLVKKARDYKKVAGLVSLSFSAFVIGRTERQEWSQQLSSLRSRLSSFSRNELPNLRIQELFFIRIQ